MHLVPENASAIGCIVAIDPGSETLGVADFHIDVNTLEILGCSARTFRGSKLGFSDWRAENMSAQHARIHAHYLNLLTFLQDKQPFAVVCEAPFFSGRFPQAFAPLIRTLDAVQFAVWDYCNYVQLSSIDPPTVKKSVRAPGNAKKPEMLTAVMALTDLNYTGVIPLELLDEHSIDSLAVGYWKIRQLREGK